MKNTAKKIIALALATLTAASLCACTEAEDRDERRSKKDKSDSKPTFSITEAITEEVSPFTFVGEGNFTSVYTKDDEVSNKVILCDTEGEYYSLTTTPTTEFLFEKEEFIRMNYFDSRLEGNASELFSDSLILNVAGTGTTINFPYNGETVAFASTRYDTNYFYMFYEDGGKWSLTLYSYADNMGTIQTECNQLPIAIFAENLDTELEVVDVIVEPSGTLWLVDRQGRYFHMGSDESIDTVIKEDRVLFTRSNDACSMEDVQNYIVTDFGLLFVKNGENDRFYFSSIQSINLPAGLTVDNIVSVSGNIITDDQGNVYTPSYGDFVQHELLTKLNKEGKIAKIVFSWHYIGVLFNDGSFGYIMA